MKNEYLFIFLHNLIFVTTRQRANGKGRKGQTDDKKLQSIYFSVLKSILPLNKPFTIRLLPLAK